MEQTLVPPDIHSAVFLDAINADAVDDMSLGQLALAKAFFGKKLSERMANPKSMDEVATFRKADGQDWSGHTSLAEHEASKPAPVPPENSEDSLHSILAMLLQHERSSEADLANFARKLEVGVKDQQAYFGVPEGIRGFTDVKDIFRSVGKMSSYKANKITDRATYFTYGSSADRTEIGAAPKLPKMAEAFTQGTVSGENLDRTVALNADVMKYASGVGQTREYAEAIMRAVEPLILEAATSATPEEFRREKHRLIEKLAHHIDADGPPPIRSPGQEGGQRSAVTSARGRFHHSFYAPGPGVGRNTARVPEYESEL